MAIKFDELLKAIQELGKSDLEKLKEALKLKGASEESVRSANELLKMSMEELEILKEQQELRLQTSHTLNDHLENRKAQVELAKAELAEMAQRNHLKGEVLKQLDEILKTTGKITEEQMAAFNKEGLGDYVQRLSDAKQNLKILEDGTKKYGRTTDKIFGGIAQQLGINSKLSESFVGQMHKLTSAIAKGGEEGEQAMAALISSFGAYLNITNLVLAATSKVFQVSKELFGQYDAANASLAKQTGLGKAYSDVLYSSQRQANLFGVKMEDAARAIGTLNDKTSLFASLSKEQQSSIAVTTAKLDKLQVSADDSAKLFENFTRVLGKSTKEAQKMQVNLAMAGVAIGVSAKDITKNFSSSLSTLAVYGDKSIDVFYGIQAAAKAANVDVSALLNIAKKFDTFSGAAEGVAKFNALLGTQLSTTEMLMMTEDERIKTLIESVQAQGVAFKDMDKFTQQSIAAAAGISDMNEANRIFGMSIKEYEKNEAVLKQNADAQKKFDDAVKDTLKVTEEFKLLFTELAVLVKPALDSMGAAVRSVSDYLGGLKSETKEMIGGIVMIVGGLTALTLVLGPIVGLFGGLRAMWVAGRAAAAFFTAATAAQNAALATQAATAAPAAAGITSVGTAAAAAAPEVATLSAAAAPIAGISWAMAAAVVGLGIALWALSEPIVVLITALKELLILGMQMVGGAFGAIGSFLGIGPNQDLAQIDAMKESSKQALISLDSIAKADFSKAITAIKGISAAVNEINGNAEVKSTIENLAQIVGTATTSVTNSKTSSALTTIQNNVSNVFSGMKMTLKVGEQEFDGYVESLVNQ
jgi:hypothetical protein